MSKFKQYGANSHHLIIRTASLYNAHFLTSCIFANKELPSTPPENLRTWKRNI